MKVVVDKAVELKWEKVDDHVFRAKIEGGWLVKAYEGIGYPKPEGRGWMGYDCKIAICFVPDPKYNWKL
jgi:hypothetical protein